MPSRRQPTARTAPQPYTTWTTYGGGAHSSQYSALDQINKSNVSQLEVVWTFPVTGTVIFNPLVVDDVMYLQASDNTLAAVDAATGKEIWRRQMQGTIGARGMNYWESPDRSDRRLLFICTAATSRPSTRRPARRFRASATTAAWICGSRSTGRRRRPLQTSNPGRIFENTMIVSLPAQGAGYDATPADVQAYDVRTGKVQWVFHSIPHPGEFGYDTWPPEAYKKSGGVHNWSEFTVDERRGIAFISFGSPRFDFYGGDRPGNNLFGNSLVALDARTGKRIWHHQLVHHDLWDYDLPQAPKLLTIRQNGRSIDVVAQATKHGFLFVFEREDRHARSGRSRNGRCRSPTCRASMSSPTQPFPTKPAPFARQTFTEKDINPYLPRRTEQARCAALCKSLRNEGLFTPPSFEGSDLDAGPQRRRELRDLRRRSDSRGDVRRARRRCRRSLRLTLPGSGRTAAWSGAGPDRHAGAEGAADRRRPRTLLAKGGPVRLAVAVRVHESEQRRSMSAVGPPWSEMTAYDLNTGEIKWRIPTGTRARAARAADSAEHRLSLPAQRSAGDGWRPRVLRHGVRPPVPRLRSRQRSRSVVHGASRNVGRDACDLCDQRPAVHRCSCRRQPWNVRRTLWRAGWSQRTSGAVHRVGVETVDEERPDMHNRLRDAFIAIVLGSAATLTITAQQPAGRGGAGARGGAPTARPNRIAGHPNLNGIWQAINSANWNLESHSASATAFWQLGALFAVPPGQSVIVDNNGIIPYTPEGLKKRQENRAGWPKSDPEAKCYMPGLPRATYMPYPFQIVQGEKDILFIYDTPAGIAPSI